MARISNIPTITIANAGKVLPSVLIKSAAKCSVRECDETEKNKFVAYVDEGKESFDVSLVFDGDKQLIGHHCDCKSAGSFCHHRTALLLYITGDKQTGEKKKSRKQPPLSKTQQLMDSLDRPALSAWLFSLLQNNKDLEMAFLHHFDKKDQLSPEDVKQLTRDAVFSLIKKAHKADASEVKKIVLLWKQVHYPVIEAYQRRPDDVNTFQNLQALVLTCMEFNNNANRLGNEAGLYIKKSLDSCLAAVAGLQQDEDWRNAVSLFTSHLLNERNPHELVNQYFLYYLQKLASLGNKERKNILVERMIDQARVLRKKRVEHPAFTKVLLDVVLETSSLETYLTDFIPIQHQDNYNTFLIKKYIEAGLINEAETFCNEQMTFRNRDQDNLNYLLLLQSIYKIRNDQEKSLMMAKKLVTMAWQLEDFLLVASSIKDEKERNNYRSRLFSKAQTKGTRAAVSFCFSLLNYEMKYRKMIELVRSSSSRYALLYQYFDKMYDADKNIFLQQLLSKNDDTWRFGEETAGEQKMIGLLAERILNGYSHSYLRTEIKKVDSESYYGRPNQLVRFLQHKLKPEK